MGSLSVAIALLPDRELSNRLAAAAFAAHGGTGGRLRWPRMPAHLSLKQPCAVDSLAPVERCFEQIAAELPPVSITLGSVEIQPPSQNGPESVAWVTVQDCPALHELRQRLVRELGASAEPATPPEPRFHLTLGFLPAAHLIAPERLPTFQGSVATLSELGLFVYDGLPRAGWQCMLSARRALEPRPR